MRILLSFGQDAAIHAREVEAAPLLPVFICRFMLVLAKEPMDWTAAVEYCEVLRSVQTTDWAHLSEPLPFQSSFFGPSPFWASRVGPFLDLLTTFFGPPLVGLHFLGSFIIN